MKTLFLILISIPATAQMFTFEREKIVLKTDTMEVRAAFELIDKIIPWQAKMYDRVVIINNQKYWRSPFIINRLILGKYKAYTMIQGRRRKIHI